MNRQTAASLIIWPNTRLKLFSSAVVVVLAGSIIGWIVQSTFIESPPNSFPSFTTYDAKHPANNKVLLHINTMQQSVVEQMLSITETLLNQPADKSNNMRLEIVANASGLNILRKNSPYAQRIQFIVNKHDNVSFLACGLTKQIMALKEEQEIELNEVVKDVPAALDQIVKRMDDGWLYVHN